ncbi:rwd domain-containing protein [Tieghemiomyces parasiticus]|uniref:Rwd domain-containing protein n=1 Tax=Tieghemiomyces parasiticus TaxID=78921 RepID=A0A9W7ZNF1_9FUNG|nr:rwd domain-containing protein [Tieghemiomyces parasiticus]
MPSHVAFTDTYPDKLPEFKVLTDDAEELTREDRVKLNEVAQQTAEESLGMAMVFSMASVVKEMFDLILIEKAAAKQAADDARLAKEMELEQAKFVGTRVAPESFMAWKAKFDAEMAEIQRAQNSQKRNVEKNKKLTGRQMFEKDKSLARSDANFMEEGDTAVDASLFERVVSIRDDSDTSDRGSDAEE